VTVSAEDDARLKAVYEARDFWNAELLKLGSSFRLGAVTHVNGQIDLKEFLPKLRAVPLNPFRLPETLRKIDGDVIIAMSDDSFDPFTQGWLSPTKLLVGIHNGRSDASPKSVGTAKVVAHELGHVIGLGDNQNPKTLMCSSPIWCLYDSPTESFLALTDREKARLMAMYPPDWQDKASRRWKGDAPAGPG
jgi:hypothetical protein